MSVVLRKPNDQEINAVKVQIENVLVESLNKSSIPDDMKLEIEKIVKDVVTSAVKELVNELKKTSFGSLDKNGDGVVSVNEVKEVVGENVEKLGCSCTIA